MNFPYYLLLPLLAAVVYAVAALAIKRAFAFGMGMWRMTFLANMAMGVLFIPLIFLGGVDEPTGRWYQPLLGGLAFFTGQIFTFLALEKGDVSVATPVLGSKVLLVAFFSTFLVAQPITATLWIAAGLTTLGLFLLQGSTPVERRRILPTILLSATSAAAFALNDVLIQRWAPLWGIGHFLPLMFGALSLYSLAFIPFFRGPLLAFPRSGAAWVVSGCLLLALQALILTVTFGTFGNATGVNVVLSSRGLISILLVWMVGHWFANTEQHLGRAVLGKRLAGAVLLVAAIITLFIDES